MEDDVILLSALIEKYEAGDYVPTGIAQKCYLTEQHQAQKITSWVHDDELPNYIMLRKIGVGTLSRELKKTIRGNI